MTRATAPRRHLLRTIRLLWSVAPGHVLAVLAVTAGTAMLPAASLAMVSWSVQALVDAARQGGGTAIGQATIAGLALAATSVLTHLLGVVRTYLETLLRHKLAIAVNERVMAKALRLELRHFEDAVVYDSLERANQGSDIRSYQIFAGLLATVSNAVTLASMGAVLLSWSAPVALLLLLAPTPLAVAQVVHTRACWRVERERSADRRRVAYLEHLVTHDQTFKETRLFALGGLFYQRFLDLVGTFFLVDRALARRHAVVSGLLGLTGATTVGAAIVLAVRDAAQTGQIGQFAGYVTSMMLIQSSVRTFFDSLAQLHEHRLYLGNLFEFLDIPEPVRTPATRIFPGKVSKGIEFRDVSFTYPGATEPVLDRFSLFVPAGTCVALVGSNGAGKTTLVKLLARFYEPTAGAILIDGFPINEYDIDDLRGHIGVIFQDFVEYEAPAQENIGFGRVAELDDTRRARNAAARARADVFLNELPAGLDTQLGRWFKGGRQLSGGEWQKMALARAFFRGAPITVLDEPTAAIDAAAEAEIFERLADVASASTTLLIAHRFSTVRAAADRIAVIDQGRVVEEGTHNELVAQDGTYARLFRLQAAGYRDSNLSVAGIPDPRMSFPSSR